LVKDEKKKSAHFIWGGPPFSIVILL